jgi:cytochrome c
MMKLNTKLVATLGIFTALLMNVTSASALTDEEIKPIMKQSNCFKCHAEKEGKAKDGPSYQKIAEKNKAKPDIEAKFYKRITSLEKVEIKGKKEDHEPLKTKDDAEVKAIVQWILSR